MSASVLLLHGLWMRSFTMGMVKLRLLEAGFPVHTFEYASLAPETLDATLARLREVVRHSKTPLHIVGHSLGGLLALRAFAAPWSEPAPIRIVCLGSPLLGSATARGLAYFGGEALLGAGKELLEHGLERWQGAAQVGVIAGQVRLGLGAMLRQLSGDHDGCVAVAETQLPGVAAHCVLEANHTGLVLSPEVARQTIYFLRHGQFMPAPAPA